MPRLHFSIQVDAPRETVWHTMIADDTYRLWSAVFMPGSHFVGNWDQGGKLYFVSADAEGKLTGMVSTVVENRPHSFISLQHLGLVSDNVEDTMSQAAKEWNGFENYTFTNQGDQTELAVDVDVTDEHRSYFQETWPKALQKLKELAEQQC